MRASRVIPLAELGIDPGISCDPLVCGLLVYTDGLCFVRLLIFLSLASLTSEEWSQSRFSLFESQLSSLSFSNLY